MNNPSTTSTTPSTESLSRLTVSQKVLTNDSTSVSSKIESPESPTLIRRRKIFGTCKGCGQPNTNFNECQSCIQWLNESNFLTLKSLIIRRKSLIRNQSCNNCNQPKHIHYKIAACENCGFPEYDVMDLYDVAIQDIYDDDDYDHDDDDDDDEFIGIKISDLPCSRCDLPMSSWLKCPDYDEVIDMICMELNEMDYDDPDYQKLWAAKEHYENLLQQDDQWVTDEGDDDDYEKDESDEEYERYGIIGPMTALSILGSQKTISTTSSLLFKFASTN